MRTSNFRDMFAVPRAVLSLFISNQCNFLCAHCCTESDSHSSEKLSNELLRLLIEHIERDSEIKGIHVSGGEPFLQVDILEQLAECAVTCSKPLAVNTNGFWIRSARLRRALKDELRGISHLFISFSKWHGQFISASEIGEAARFALSIGKQVELVLLCEYRLEESEVLIKEIFDGQTPDNLTVASGYVEPVGRATFFRGLPVVLGKSYSQPQGASGETCDLVNRPVVTQDGAYLMCCNTVNYTKGSHALRLGNLASQSLAEISKRHESDPLVQALRSLGPHFLLELSDKVAGETMRRTPAGKCTSCHILMRDTARVERVRRVLPFIQAALQGAT